MTKRGYILLNILLFFSFMLFVTVFIMTIFQSDKNHAVVLNLFPVFLMLVGVTVMILTPYTQSAYQLFLGGMFFISGLFSYLLLECIIPGTLTQWWPIYGVMAGLMVGVSGFYKYKKCDSGFMIPAVVMILLCGCFMLFSFKIITIPFKMFMALFGPILILIMCTALMSIFFYQKKFKKIQDSDEDIKQFEDDEMIPD